MSERQFTIARYTSVAKSRPEIANMLGVSEAVVDAELKEIYLILGVRGAGELIRVIASTGMDAIENVNPSGLLRNSGHDLPIATVRSGSRAIGYSDFGPADGKPVVILHSTITGRSPPTRLIETMEKNGFRAIAIDRPGFGDTDPGHSSPDPYELAAQDLAVVCDSLGLSAIDAIARGSGQAAVRLAQLQPALIKRVVLVNPTPAFAFTTIDQGPLGAVKRAFGRRPWAVELMLRMMVPYATARRLHDGMLRAFRDSEPDFALVRDDPQFTADYLRAVRCFAQGKLAGYVAEQAAWGKGYDVTAAPGMTDWRIVQGRHFVLHSPEMAMKYWGDKLPNTPVTWVEDAGQMLAYSHPEHVVAALC